MMNHHHHSTPIPAVCGQCGIADPNFLHHIRHRATFRRLCTTCILRLHPHSFCPTCLTVYDRSPPPDAVVCSKCYSSSHPTCVSPPIASSRASSPCLLCLNPNSLILDLNRVESRNVTRAVDRTAARLLLAAAKIAAMSMGKAEVAAAMEAERRAKEAAFARKRAREALEHVVRLMAKEMNNNSNNNKQICTSVSVVESKCDDSSEVVEALDAVELVESVVDGKDFDCENGGVVKVVQNGH